LGTSKFISGVSLSQVLCQRGQGRAFIPYLYYYERIKAVEGARPVRPADEEPMPFFWTPYPENRCGTLVISEEERAVHKSVPGKIYGTPFKARKGIVIRFSSSQRHFCGELSDCISAAVTGLRGLCLNMYHVTQRGLERFACLTGFFAYAIKRSYYRKNIL